MFLSSGINITPKEFELLVCDWLAQQGSNIASLTVMHDQKIKAYDSTYQIDVVAKFQAFSGADFTVLVECKKYSAPVEREKVQVLHDKVRSIGAHKGMLFSTSGFQSGAIDYATQHGIALLTVADGAVSYQTRMLSKAPKKLGNGFPKYSMWHVSVNDAGNTSFRNVLSTKLNPLDLWRSEGT